MNRKFFPPPISLVNAVTKDDNRFDTVHKQRTMKAYRGHGGKAQTIKTRSTVINDESWFCWLGL